VYFGHQEFGGVVRIAQVSSIVLSGWRQCSHKPAGGNGTFERAKVVGLLLFQPYFFHS
jgi:hypothetical protein